MADYGKLIGHRVISIEEGKKCGNIIDFLVDYEKFEVFALIVKGGWSREAEIILFSDVESFGTDAVMILNSKAIKSAKNSKRAETAIKNHINVSKLEVVTNAGHVVGKIATFEFDPFNGKVRQFEIAGSVLKSIFEGRNIIPVSQIISIGGDAMIVHDKKEAAAPKKKPVKKDSAKKAATKPSSKKKSPSKKTPGKKKSTGKKKSSSKKKPASKKSGSTSTKKK